MRKILILSVLVELSWISGRIGGFSAFLKDAVQVRYVEERTQAGDGEEHGGFLEGVKERQGITIRLDEGSVSIFRLEEHMEPGSDGE